MTFSPSTQAPLMITHGSHRTDRPMSLTPPQPALSKRDKRRTVLLDKLNDLTTSFSMNRDAHYRAQLQALQVDMQLLVKADPYRSTPLDDTGEDVAEMVAAATGAIGAHSANNGGAQAGLRRAEGDTAALAGRYYMPFVEQVNNIMEERDAQLTMLERKYARDLQEILNTNRYNIRLAEEEHAILSRTVRERLMQSLAEKKKRLMREKEQLDIADSNALLLHPSQFSITNPSSPGGTQSNRKTRHTRHRPGEVEENPNGIASTDGSHKRKRKAVYDVDDNGSPGPVGRIPEPGTSSPYRDARARLAATQFESPLYSIDKLFTEKELAMHLNTAATATANFFASEKSQGMNGGSTEQDVENEDGTDESNKIGGNNDTEMIAPELDRTANTSHHATRSTRNQGSAALNLLGDLAMSEKNAFVPIVLPSSIITKTGNAPTPPPLEADYVRDDLVKFERLRNASPGTVDRKLVDELTMPVANPSFRNGQIPSAESAVTNAAATASSAVPVALSGSVPMSNQSSVGGLSEVGPVAMKRDEGSSMGSSAMKRNASGAGLGAASDSGKRARNR